MGVIFGLSTDMFSSDHTSRFIVPLLNFFFPFLSTQNVELIHELIRKSAHVTEYFILGLLLFRAFRGHSYQEWHLEWTLYAAIVVMLYAMCDEFHQSFVASRGASLGDAAIDTAGGVFSQIVIIFRHFLWKR